VVVAEVHDKMAVKMTLEKIKEHWEQSGRQFPKEGKVFPTSRDPYLGQLEEENILRYLSEHNHVLEVGCGDGLHTTKYARSVKRLSAIDIAESLIQLARKRMYSEGVANVSFTVGSVLDIRELFGLSQFDCVVSQRCLINLPDWQYQQDAIIQVSDVLQNGGIFLLTEGFQDELDNLNAIRQRINLDTIGVVDYNRNLTRRDFEDFVSNYFEILEIHDYGFYLFLSRVFHPLAVLPHGPEHDSRLNEVAMEISRVVQVPDFRKYSFNLFYALRRK
jgi:SAM-dependent methyltransferase